jgi:hypothetical protein
MPKAKEPATIPKEQGVVLIDQMLKDIKRTPSLRGTDFGNSVRFKITGIRAHIKDGGFFSRRMEAALESWNFAIQRHIKLDSEELIQ